MRVHGVVLGLKTTGGSLRHDVGGVLGNSDFPARAYSAIETRSRPEANRGPTGSVFLREINQWARGVTT